MSISAAAFEAEYMPKPEKSGLTKERAAAEEVLTTMDPFPPAVEAIAGICTHTGTICREGTGQGRARGVGCRSSVRYCIEGKLMCLLSSTPEQEQFGPKIMPQLRHYVSAGDYHPIFDIRSAVA